MLEDGRIDKDTEKFAVVIAVGVALMKLARTDNGYMFCRLHTVSWSRAEYR